MQKHVQVIATLILAIMLALTPALAEEVNIYTSRQPELIQPIFDAFTAKTGTMVNVLYAGKGLIERLKAEGDHLNRFLHW